MAYFAMLSGQVWRLKLLGEDRDKELVKGVASAGLVAGD